MIRAPVDPQLYAAFLGVMAVMAVTPGPANLFSIANGARRGWKGAMLGVVGMNAATLVWFGAAAVGLGALVTAFPRAFQLLSLVGAAYVAWLGVQALRGAFTQAPSSEAASGRPGRDPLVDGFLIQMANPKVILFFTAVLPPFMDVSRPAAPQLALFAAGTISLDVMAMAAYGLGGAALTRRMSEPRFHRGFALGSGLLLLAAAGLIVARL